MQSLLHLTGAGGLLGRALAPRLTHEGFTVRPVSRDSRWVPDLGTCDPSLFRGSEAVVHLAGEPIASGRWSPQRKQAIRDSRVRGTHALATALASLDAPPRVLVCASAVGMYGNRGEETLTEASAAGKGFLAEVVREWEEATAPAREAGIRVVQLRLGVVLSREGGALTKMLPVFRLGLGGPVGDGRAWMSWIHMEDAVEAFTRAVQDAAWEGAYNLTAPHPVRNRDLARELGRVLGRPALLPVPKAVIRLMLGEMGERLLFDSTRVQPARLRGELGFHFAHPNLSEALANLLQKG